MDDYARIEVQQVVNVLNAWLKPYSIKLTLYDTGHGLVYDEKAAEWDDRDRSFPTLPHAVEWALNEASQRIFEEEVARRLKSALEDDGDDDE